MFSLWPAISFTSRNIDSAPLAVVLISIHYWVAPPPSQENRPKISEAGVRTMTTSRRCGAPFARANFPNALGLDEVSSALRQGRATSASQFSPARRVRALLGARNKRGLGRL